MNTTQENQAPAISEISCVADASAYWPLSMAHLNRPYSDGASEYVVIGEINDQPIAGFKGYRKVSVALVPPEALERVVFSTEATGWHVEANGPQPGFHSGTKHASGFWIEGIEHGERYEPLINAWSASNHEIMLPDNSMLMVYGLVPRHLQDGTVCWDDPYRPVYDVIRVRSHADSTSQARVPTTVLVEMRRDYLSDYCSLKGCFPVAFYFEERRSDNDDLFDRVLNGEENVDFILPGRLLNLQDHRAYQSVGRQYSQAWGRRIVLTHSERHITEAEDPVLEWPDHVGPMSLERASREWLYAYVTDDVLSAYQARSEFDVSPMSGTVSYRGQWAVSYARRYGRNHIQIEIKKLYEGCPPSVIAHWHQYAVKAAVAKHDRAILGDRHIGLRAKEFVYAFLSLTDVLASLAEQLSLSFGQSDIGRFSTNDVNYQGWWTFDELSRLGNVAAMSSTRDDFLSCSVVIVKVLESLQVAPLRNIVVKLGIDKRSVKDFGAFKLIGALCQLAALAKDGGHSWPSDVSAVVGMWDTNAKLASLKRVFAVNQLRILATHQTGGDIEAGIARDAAPFKIDPATCVKGWGFSIDKLYDEIIKDIQEVATLLSPND
jgi:hypothetical protein